jgi:hypothetical protein
MINSNSGDITKRARLFFLISLVILFLFSIWPVSVYSVRALNYFKTIDYKFRTNSQKMIEAIITAETPSPSGPIKSPFPTVSTVKTRTPSVVVKSCYRYKVTHLDGSTSNLCYSKENYNQLVNLGYDYSSAKTFYQFHLDGASDYQAEYDRTKSSIYLDAKASQEAQAAKEKAKMDAIIGQMQVIEKSGF